MYLLQALIFCAVVGSNIQWQWTPNNYPASGMGVGLAWIATQAIVEYRDRRARREPNKKEATPGRVASSPGDWRRHEEASWACCLCRFLRCGFAVVGVKLLSRPSFFIRQRYEKTLQFPLATKLSRRLSLVSASSYSHAHGAAVSP